MAVKTIVKIDTPELELLPKEKSAVIRNTFAPMVTMLEGFEDQYKEVLKRAAEEITPEIVADAKRLRLDMSKVRTQTETLRKQEKAEYLRAGKAIDGVSNIVKWAVTDKETKLKEIETHFETIEKERLQELQDTRVKQIIKFVPDAESRDLAGMADDVWDIYLTGAENQYQERIKAEEIAKKEREQAEKLERDKRIAAEKENKRLQKEAAARAKAEAKERAEHQKKLNKERKEREKIEAKAAADKKKADEKAAAERAKMQAKIDAEQKEKQRMADELAKEREQARLKAQQEADRLAKIEADKAAAIQAELKKGDQAKIKDLIADFEDLKGKYQFKAAKNQKMYTGVEDLIDKVVAYIKK